MMQRPCAIVWFKRDLRLTDHNPLLAAVRSGLPIIPLFIDSTGNTEACPPIAANRWWLHQSLAVLDQALCAVGSRLIIRRGDPATEIPNLIAETGATALYRHRHYEPCSYDDSLRQALSGMSVELNEFSGSLLFEPDEILRRQGGPYKVFTPFYRQCMARLDPHPPEPAPAHLRPPSQWPESLLLEVLPHEHNVDRAAGLRKAWQPGEAGALGNLSEFVKQGLGAYHLDRDRPDRPGTSRLSPHLHFGEINPARIVWEVRQAQQEDQTLNEGAEAFIRQIFWREFAWHLLYHFPHTLNQPLNEKFSDFPWEPDNAALQAWQRGQTGYPIIDAGMRQLWTTGWMHNRVRLIAGSFLVKDLLQPWQEGARWFWETLVDADTANNTLGWQWLAGCGADAAPYFRIFNPVLQAGKFDPDGAYVRRWVPELARLPDKYLQCPWTAPTEALSAAGVQLGGNYPEPIVNHNIARIRALAALKRMK